MTGLDGEVENIRSLSKEEVNKLQKKKGETAVKHEDMDEDDHWEDPI